MGRVVEMPSTIGDPHRNRRFVDPVFILRAPGRDAAFGVSGEGSFLREGSVLALRITNLGLKLVLRREEITPDAPHPQDLLERHEDYGALPAKKDAALAIKRKVTEEELRSPADQAVHGPGLIADSTNVVVGKLTEQQAERVT